MIKKMWVKFNELDIQCICDYDYRKCKIDERDGCKEYIVKFTEIERTYNTSGIDEVNKSLKVLNKEVKKIETELQKSIRKFKI